MVRKNVVTLLLVMVAAVGSLPSAAQSNESLGEAARRLRAEKNKAAGQGTASVPLAARTLPAATLPSRKDAEAWQEQVDRGEAAMSNGDYVSAEKLFQRALELAEETQDQAAVNGALQWLAIIHQKTNRPKEAEAALTRALEITAQLPRPMNRQWAGAAMNAAAFYEQNGRPQQAEQLYGRLIAFLEKEVGADSPALRLPLGKLITLLKSQGRKAEAAQYESRREKLPVMPGMAK